MADQDGSSDLPSCSFCNGRPVVEHYQHGEPFIQLFPPGAEPVSIDDFYACAACWPLLAAGDVPGFLVRMESLPLSTWSKGTLQLSLREWREYAEIYFRACVTVYRGKIG